MEDNDDSMTEHRKRCEQYVARYVQPRGDEPQVMYDIGVGGGREAWSLRELFPGMKVVGVEPHPDDVLRLSRDGYPGTLVCAAVLDYDGRAAVKLGRPGTGHTHVHESGDTEVECFTLDTLDRTFGCPDDVLLWADIEGSELRALRGGTGLLSSGRCKWINLEARHAGAVDGWPSEKELTDFLAQFGYTKACDYNNQITHWDVVYRL